MKRIYTIGHSTRTLLEFVRLLREHDVTRLADIRRYPGSRRHPHFAGESLAHSLPRAGILYEHFPDLGGRRNPRKNSPNGAWENPQFRGYADHMATPEFHAAIDRLLSGAAGFSPPEEPQEEAQGDLGGLKPAAPPSPSPVTAIMCAEAVPWRCHRNLTSDELVRRGIDVIHILGPGSAQPHALNPMARIEPDRVIYPPPQAQMF